MVATRTRDATARERIKAYLAEHGPVTDEHGGATTLLREAVAYHGSSVAFIQLITAMDDAGEISRNIRGKRTYAITGVESASRPAAAPVRQPAVRPAASTQAPAAPAIPAIDYDLLAKALLNELARVLSANLAGEAANGEHTQELLSEQDRLRAERDDYAARLQAARQQLSGLMALYDKDEVAADAAEETAPKQRRSRRPGTAAERAS